MPHCGEFLRKMGFKHKKVNDKRYIYEQPSIIYQRHAYLRRMRVNRREGRPGVYLMPATYESEPT